ncbi:helix-turn-helix domain-containing protein [Compostibacter hankyongensis]|uniref:HTH cro/C1-type domain-containing protein n=1 Tax=Compostibacter hankyongensis TaxID=1007089 RepID=A0ABP8G6H7_9BACT
MKISSNRQYHTALAKIEAFIEKGFGNLTATETEQLRVISLAVEAYEKEKYPMPVTTTIASILEEYMYENKLNKGQLSQILEVPNSTLSEIINGKRKLNLRIVKKLHQKLNIDGNFLLETA